MFLLAYLIEKIKKSFKPTTYGEELETFVVSHNPSTSADVEYWITQYDRRQQRARGGMFSYR
jgi:hypothetical protein